MRKFADRLLTGIDQIGIFLTGIGEWSDAEHAVLALQRYVHAVRNVVGHQRRDADAKVDVISVFQFLGRAGGHLVAIPAHYAASLSRVVTNSIFLS